MSTMFVGVYWSQRKESREEVAEKLARFLAAIASASKPLSTWFTKGRAKTSARTPIALDTVSVASRLKTNQRDVGGEAMSELGFSLGIWNGENVSLAATVGAHSPHVRNSVVLSFAERPSDFDADTWKDLLRLSVREFDPDHGVVGSAEYLVQQTTADPWETGWFTYRRGTPIAEHPFE